MWEKYPPVTIQKGLIAYFRYSIECGTMFIQKYINLYFNKSITKCVKATLYKMPKLFLGEVKIVTVLISVSASCGKGS